MTRGMIGFKPITDGDFRCFWCIGNAWGVFRQDQERAELSVLYGQLEVRELQLAFEPTAVEFKQRTVAFALHSPGVLHLARRLVMMPGDELIIRSQA